MKKHFLSKQPVAGFTIFEILIVVIMIGVLSAFAVPSWLQIFNQQRLNVTQDRVLAVMRDAQANAKRQNQAWQACFWDDGTQVLSAVRPVPFNSNSNCSQVVNWQALIGTDSKSITINQNQKYSNLTQTAAGSGYYGLQYTLNGWVDNNNGQLLNNGGQLPQQITFALRNQNSNSQRCVIIFTLLGAIRTDKDINCKLQ